MNYLPVNRKKELRKEYLLRLSIVSFSTILVVLICAIIFLLPSYINSYLQRSQALLKHPGGKSLEIKEVEIQAKNITDLANRFSEGVSRMNTIEAIALAQQSLVPGVSLKGFEFTYTASSTVDMRVSGKARTREALVLFKKKVEANPLVQKVELPVSDLTKSKDLSFMMRIISK